MELKTGYTETEVGVIPEDWRIGKLGSLTDPTRTIRYGIVQPGQFARSGDLMLRNQDYSNGWVDPETMHRVRPELTAQYQNARLRFGDLIMTVVGANTGQVVDTPLWLDGGVLSRSTARIAIHKQKADRNFIKFCLQSLYGKRQTLDHLKEGAQPVLSCADLAKFRIPLPPTKAEQEAIAAALSDVDALISALDQLIAKKRDRKQAAMQQLLTGKQRLPGFRGEWEVKRLGEIAQPRKDRIDPRKKGVQEFCVELEHIEQGTGHLTGYIATADGSSLKSVFQKGDVLFGKLRAYLRKYWLANREGVCSTEIWVLMANRSLLLPEFLFQLVKLDRFVEAASIAYGTHMPRSDWNVVKNYEVHLPLLDEQTAIATILSDMDAELTALEQRRDKTRALKQGMMQELLTGKTRLV